MDNFAPIKLKGKDILLLLLYFPGKTQNIGEGIVGATRLVKAMFLFEQEFKKDFKADIQGFPEFMAWKFGPWSGQLLDDIEFFKGIGFITSKPYEKNNELPIADEEELDKWEKEFLDEPLTPDLYEPQSFYLTNTGKGYVESYLLSRLTENQKNTLSSFKKKINSLSLFSILSYVYKKYSKTEEDWTKKSIIKEEILGEARIA